MVSDKELEELEMDASFSLQPRQNTRNWVNKIMLDKQPLEQIASGVLVDEDLQYRIRKSLDGFASEVPETDFLNKRVKIFIQLAEVGK